MPTIFEKSITEMNRGKHATKIAYVLSQQPKFVQKERTKRTGMQMISEDYVSSDLSNTARVVFPTASTTVPLCGLF